MTVQEFLGQATLQLQAAAITSARLDVLILLEDVLNKDRGLLLAHPEIVLTDSQLDLLNTFIVQRIKHLPLAYIRGRAAFYGRDFIVNTHVLVPRPETESMITLLKDCHFLEGAKLADIGTGSGCIGITAALEFPAAEVYVYDTSAEALKVAAANAALYKVRVQAAQQDLLTGAQEHFAVILANLPYVPTDYPVNKAASLEPAEALFSGTDGLDHYRIFWKQIAGLATKPQDVITEALPAQHASLTQLAAEAGYALHANLGFAQRFTRKG